MLATARRTTTGTRPVPTVDAVAHLESKAVEPPTAGFPI